jgi:hypothetical protein
MRPVETTLRTGGGEIKENDEGVNLRHIANTCNCHNVSPSTVII